MRLMKAMLAKQFAKNKKINNRRENNVVRVEWCRKTNRFASSQCPGDFYLESKEAQDDSGCVRGQIRRADHLRFDVSEQFAAEVSQVFTFLPATRPGMAKTSLHKKKHREYNRTTSETQVDSGFMRGQIRETDFGAEVSQMLPFRKINTSVGFFFCFGNDKLVPI